RVISRYRMKMPGVSLMAVASPTATPPHREPYLMYQRKSSSTRNSSIMLTWPKLTVSRSGSNTATNTAATATVNHRDQPNRSATGRRNQYRTTSVDTTVPAMVSVFAAHHGRIPIGAMIIAAKGGYVNPYRLYGFT